MHEGMWAMNSRHQDQRRKMISAVAGSY